LLEHDLEVHLLGKALPALQLSQGRRSGDAAVPASAAREARRLVDLALAAHPPTTSIRPPRRASSLNSPVPSMRPHQISDDMVRVVSPDEDVDDERSSTE
jgi:hypothetical protein